MTTDRLDARHAAPTSRRVTAQARFEGRQLLSHGEQLLVSIVLPALALVGLAMTDSPSLGPGRRIDLATAGVLALAVVSTAFTGAAIQLAYERRYGVLRLLGTTPLGRGGLLTGKALALSGVLVTHLVVLSLLALALGWRPQPAGLLPAAVVVVLGVAAFAALAVVVGGRLRAEAVLAVANLLWMLLLVGGGLLLPADQLPAALGTVVQWLPSAALADGLRVALVEGGWPWADLGLLAAWSAVLGALATRLLRWSD